jgi:hypothetical protein
VLAALIAPPSVDSNLRVRNGRPDRESYSNLIPGVSIETRDLPTTVPCPPSPRVPGSSCTSKTSYPAPSANPFRPFFGHAHSDPVIYPFHRSSRTSRPHRRRSSDLFCHSASVKIVLASRISRAFAHHSSGWKGMTGETRRNKTADRSAKRRSRQDVPTPRSFHRRFHFPSLSSPRSRSCMREGLRTRQKDKGGGQATVIVARHMFVAPRWI